LAVSAPSKSSKEKKRPWILQGSSGKATSGQLTAVLGASGAGKTTLLATLATAGGAGAGLSKGLKIFFCNK